MIPAALTRLAHALPPVCHARLPRTGLGNMLLVWARAAAFAELNGLPLVTTGFGAVRVGPWLRGERQKRIYVADFLPPSPARLAHATTLALAGRVVREPPVARLPEGADKNGTVYVYDTLPDFFMSFAEHRDFLRRSLLAMLAPTRRRALDAAAAPFIGVHVRGGDFGPLAPGHDLSRSLGPTPLSHFIRLIEGIRAIASEPVPVTVFSDSSDHELAPLLALPRTTRAPERPAIVDLLLLARSRVVIPSAWSTFSMWSAFLSDAPVLLHPMEHEHLRSIRPASLNRRFYEGTVPQNIADWPPLLRENLAALKTRTP
ncbi:hypothetical protein [Polyangium sp. y55x31]|uniref:hypothetical protein n=1 Tax=Polyangium sp. y55x31 TaxID=3042688 RepID=UPI0024824F0D|nr:hypothetical protein [Polyangium sp. y55x31]MDI1483033.1 hypothetical protein [Polyangium sp. y55x31]